MILLWRSLMNRPKMKKMVTMKKTRMMRKKKRIQKMKNPRRRKLLLSPKKLQPSLKRKLQQIVTQALDQSTIPEVAPMMRRRKFQVMAAEVIMNLMNPSKLEEEPRARRRPPKETVMAIVAERSGEAKRRDPRAEKRKIAVTTRIAITKSQKQRRVKREVEMVTQLLLNCPKSWQTLLAEMRCQDMRLLNECGLTSKTINFRIPRTNSLSNVTRS